MENKRTGSRDFRVCQEPAPGEEFIEPVITPRTTVDYDPTRHKSRRNHQPDEVLDASKYVTGFGDVYNDNEVWGGEERSSGTGTRSPQSGPDRAQTRRQISQPEISVNNETVGDDGFPWNPPPRKESHSVIDIEPQSVITHHDMRRASRVSTTTTAKNKEKSKCFLCWRHLVTKLEDNRVQTQEAMQKLLLLEQTQDKNFRWLKKIMNLLFLAAALLLLLALIVLIIYTDPKFSEIIKTFTIFLAGVRQGLW